VCSSDLLIISGGCPAPEIEMEKRKGLPKCFPTGPICMNLSMNRDLRDYESSLGSEEVA